MPDILEYLLEVHISVSVQCLNKGEALRTPVALQAREEPI